MHEHGHLSQTDIDQRKENISKRHRLCLEWYDIHSNKDLSYTESPQIVLNRLKIESAEEYETLQTILQNENDTIRTSIRHVTTDLKNTIINHSVPPSSRNGRESTLIRTQYTPGLFSVPHSVQHKMHLEEMATLSEHIQQFSLTN